MKIEGPAILGPNSTNPGKAKISFPCTPGGMASEGQIIKLNPLTTQFLTVDLCAGVSLPSRLHPQGSQSLCNREHYSCQPVFTGLALQHPVLRLLIISVSAAPSGQQREPVLNKSPPTPPHPRLPPIL